MTSASTHESAEIVMPVIVLAESTAAVSARWSEIRDALARLATPRHAALDLRFVLSAESSVVAVPMQDADGWLPRKPLGRALGVPSAVTVVSAAIAQSLRVVRDDGRRGMRATIIAIVARGDELVRALAALDDDRLRPTPVVVETDPDRTGALAGATVYRPLLDAPLEDAATSLSDALVATDNLITAGTPGLSLPTGSAQLARVDGPALLPR